MVGTVLIKRICGHSSPYTFKPNERYARDRFQKFLSKKCPECTLAAIKALEAQQKASAAQQRLEERQRKEVLGKEILARNDAAGRQQISEISAEAK